MVGADASLLHPLWRFPVVFSCGVPERRVGRVEYEVGCTCDGIGGFALVASVGVGVSGWR